MKKENLNHPCMGTCSGHTTAHVLGIEEGKKHGRREFIAFLDLLVSADETDSDIVWDLIFHKRKELRGLDK